MIAKKNFTRKAFVMSSLGGLEAFFFAKPNLAYASTNELSDLHISKMGNGYEVTDSQTGDYAVAVWENNQLKVTLNGVPVILQEKDDLSTIYFNGSISMLSVPSGFRYIGTVSYGNVTPFAVFAATLLALGMPDKIGVVWSAIVSMIGSGSPAYLQIDQYLKGSQGYWVCRVYRNSNYTGLITRFEKGPFTGTRP